jgi:rod shape-determining protein MreC
MKIKKVKLLIIFLAIFGLLVFFSFFKPFSFLEEKINFILKPITSRFYNLSSNIEKEYRKHTDNRNYFEEVRELSKKVERLTVENARLKQLEDENLKLRKFLDFTEKKEGAYLLANIVSRRTTINYGEREPDIIIDKGEKHGIFPGQVVLDEEGVVIGKIKDVREGTASVNLSTNSECRLAAAVINLDRTIGIVSGNLGLTINMDFIPQCEELREGDLIITSGLEENIPRGLVIGEIKEVRKNNNEIWQDAVIEPLADFDNLTIVLIVS